MRLPHPLKRALRHHSGVQVLAPKGMWGKFQTTVVDIDFNGRASVFLLP